MERSWWAVVQVETSPAGVRYLLDTEDRSVRWSDPLPLQEPAPQGALLVGNQQAAQGIVDAIELGRTFKLDARGVPVRR